MEAIKSIIEGMRWYQWFAVAALLGAIGFGALVVLDETEATATVAEELLNGLAWLAWIFSWAGAIVSIGMGVVGIWKAKRPPQLD